MVKSSVAVVSIVIVGDSGEEFVNSLLASARLEVKLSVAAVSMVIVGDTGEEVVNSLVASASVVVSLALAERHNEKKNDHHRIQKHTVLQKQVILQCHKCHTISRNIVQSTK